MKKIFLIGDSIRAGYDSVVKDALKDVAQVYYPNDNCRFAEYVLRHLIDWKTELKLGDDIDCVHWNCGLWDTLEIFEDGTLTPLSAYENFIERICRQMKRLFPNAKCIFATSTPVLEEKFLTPDILIRRNSDIEKFNKAAIEIVKRYGHEVDDLYSIVAGVPKSYYSDMTHLYTPEGTKVISSKVISVIAKSLDIPKELIKYDFDVNTDIEIVGL